jgi:hypothetical protein
MRPVVAEWDAAVRAAVPAYARLVPEAEARGSVLRPPATEAEIAAAEARLGVSLPPSYRSFLLISNGADAANMGAGQVCRMYEIHRNELRSAGDLGESDETISCHASICLEVGGGFEDHHREPSPDGPGEVYRYEPGLQGVLLTSGVQDQIVGLIPFPGEWQVWDFGHTEVTSHLSFATFLQHETRQARTRVSERAERLKSAVGDGRGTELYDLAEHGDSRATAAACRSLFDDGRCVTAALQLVLLGDPAAVPALREALQRSRSRPRSSYPTDWPDSIIDRTKREFEAFVVKALDSCGDPDIRAELDRLAAGSSECAEFARLYLAEHENVPRW